MVGEEARGGRVYIHRAFRSVRTGNVLLGTQYITYTVCVLVTFCRERNILRTRVCVLLRSLGNVHQYVLKSGISMPDVREEYTYRLVPICSYTSNAVHALNVLGIVKCLTGPTNIGSMCILVAHAFVRGLTNVQACAFPDHTKRALRRTNVKHT